MTDAFKALAHQTARCPYCHLLLPCANCLHDVAKTAGRSGRQASGCEVLDDVAIKLRTNRRWRRNWKKRQSKQKLLP